MNPGMSISTVAFHIAVIRMRVANRKAASPNLKRSLGKRTNEHRKARERRLYDRLGTSSHRPGRKKPGEEAGRRGLGDLRVTPDRVAL
jgi:hypothetical protein